MLPAVLMKKLYDGSLTLQGPVVKQRMFATELKKVERGRTPNRKILFFKKGGLLFDRTGNDLGAFRGGE